MSRSEAEVDINGYIDMTYSSGDSNDMKSKQHYREENNNEVDELSKNFTEMGCIVDAVKRPPNICIETCVYEESDSGGQDDKSEAEDDEKSLPEDNDKHEDATYSDEFEEDKSEVEEEIKKIQSANAINVAPAAKPLVKLSKSLSSSSANKQPSLSGRSSDYGSVSVPATRRVNMSFTNERLREIERHNHILLNKILSARNVRKSSIPPREQPPRRAAPPAAVHRRLQQRQIDRDNMILLKKIQRAKSSACSVRR
ncbi:unnamed protein product, partial [Iphiclides podalirius]